MRRFFGHLITAALLAGGLIGCATAAPQRTFQPSPYLQVISLFEFTAALSTLDAKLPSPRDLYYGVVASEDLLAWNPEFPAYIPENYDCDEIALDILAQLNRGFYGRAAAPAAGIVYFHVPGAPTHHAAVVVLSDGDRPFLLDFMNGNRGWFDEFISRDGLENIRIVLF